MRIEGDCPGCKSRVGFDSESLTMAKAADLANVTTAGNVQVLEKPVEKIVEKIKEVLPDYVPAGRCKNGNCDIGIHKNPNYKTRPKGKCTNCGQFSRHKDGDCPWCKDGEKRGEIEEIDEDELDDLGIPKPTLEEHEHNHE